MVEVKKEENGSTTTAPAEDGSQKTLDPEHFRKLFIGGLSLNTTDEGLKQFYSQFGELLDCVVMRDGQTKKSRGFGFVTFSTRDEVDKAMKARPHELDGKTVDPKRAVPRDQSNRSESNISTKRLYVSGVREEHKEEDFSTYFATFGNVLKVEIITDKATDKPRGFAFVTFDDHDAVDQCVLLKSHMINNFRCDVKKALSKDEIARGQQMDRDRQDRSGRSRGNQRPQGGGQWSGRGGNYGGSRDGGYGGGWNGPPSGPWSGGPQGQWGGYGGYGGGYGGGPGSGWGGSGPQQGWSGGGQAGGGSAQGWGAGGGGAGGSWSNDAAGWGGAPTGGAGGQWGGAAGSGGWSAQAAASGGPQAGGPRF